MSQPQQVFNPGGYTYQVIDDGAPFITISSNVQSASGNWEPSTGAVGQGQNISNAINGNIPDCVQTATTEINNQTTGIYLRYKNPA